MLVLQPLLQPFGVIPGESVDDTLNRLKDLWQAYNAGTYLISPVPELAVDYIFFFTQSFDSPGISTCGNDIAVDYNGTPPSSSHFQCFGSVSMLLINDASYAATITHEFGHHRLLGDTYKGQLPAPGKLPDSMYSPANFPNAPGCRVL